MHFHFPSWVTPSPVVASLALLFTIASFWWIQVRRGRLRSYPPRTYAGEYPGHELGLILPLVLHNTGPAPITILDFRLRIDAHPGHGLCHICGRGHDPALPAVLSWRATQMQLEPAGESGGERLRPAAFPVEGRRAITQFIEFGQRSADLTLPNGPYLATVEVLLAHRGVWRWLARRSPWRRLVKFELHTELVAKDGRHLFIARSNDPGYVP